MVHLPIDSHGCGRSRHAIYDIHIDQFEDLLQIVGYGSKKKIGNEGRTYFPHCNGLSLVSQGESAQLRMVFV